MHTIILSEPLHRSIAPGERRGRYGTVSGKKKTMRLSIRTGDLEHLSHADGHAVEPEVGHPPFRNNVAYVRAWRRDNRSRLEGPDDLGDSSSCVEEISPEVNALA